MTTVKGRGGRERDQGRSRRCTHVVAALALGPVHCVGPTVQAGSHLEGLDELGVAQSAGALRHQASEPHRPAQVDLRDTHDRVRTPTLTYTLGSVSPVQFNTQQQTNTLTTCESCSY